MTTGFGIYGAVLLGLLLALVAFTFSRYRLQGGISRGAFSWRSFWREELGVVNVLYFIRGGVVTINGSATNPTAIQASQVQKQTAEIVMGDADVQALFTHNWGLDASAPTYFEPEISEVTGLILNAGGTYLTGFTFDRTNTNVVKINKLNFAGSGGTWVVSLRRPQSIGQ